jgi:hypothetical protein
MVRRVQRDYGRFQRIIRGHIRGDQLRKYITDPGLIGKQGKDHIVIPVPQIVLPRFRHGRNAPGVGQGDGEPGDPADGDGNDPGQAGSESAEHLLEVELTLDDIVDMIGDELQLPRIRPRGCHNVYGDRAQYKSIAQKGPAGLRDFRRSYQQALKRSVSEGVYNPGDPKVVITPDDMRYRFPRNIPEPESSAVLVFMRDISGSMDEKRTDIARTTFFWLESWLRRQYRRVETRYICHDAEAQVVDRDRFYQLKSSGGTTISSALEACCELVEREYPPSYWNIYPFYVSDGDNQSSDNEPCMKLLEGRLLPLANIFCYTQVAKDGNFLQTLTRAFDDDERVASHVVDELDGGKILGAMKAFLGKGR